MVGKVPLGGALSATVRLGGLFWHERAGSFANDGKDWMGGVGLEYAVAAVRLRAEYARYTLDNDTINLLGLSIINLAP